MAWTRRWVWAGVGVVLAVLLLGMSGCGKTHEPGRYYSDKGYSIRFPDGWEQQEGFMGTDVMALSPMEGAADQFRENVGVTVENLRSTMTLEEYAAAALQGMQKLCTDFEKLDEGDAVLEDGNAKWIAYSFRQGQVKVRAVVYLRVRGRRAFVLACTASPETFEQYRPQFETIARSWRLE